MPQPYAHKPRSCEGCQTPIPLPRNTRTKRCPPCQRVYARSHNVAQGGLRYVELKAEGLWPMCSVEGCDSEAKMARGTHCAAHAARLRKGQDMTVPVRKPCRVRGECSVEGCERPRHARGWRSHHWRRWHRHGGPLASRCPRYTVDELRRLNAYLGSLAGERTKLGDAELLAMSLGRSTAAISSKLYELRTVRREAARLAGTA